MRPVAPACPVLLGSSTLAAGRAYLNQVQLQTKPFEIVNEQVGSKQPHAQKLRKHPLPSIERLHELLDYNPQSGCFRWKQSRKGVRAGRIAGSARPDRYTSICVDGVSLLAHRIAWAMIYGTWPDCVDHINGVGFLNRITNLRACSHSENLRNQKVRKDNKVGLKGIHWNSKDKRWRAQIKVNGRLKYLGQFQTKEDAYAAYCKGAKQLHGEFARTV